jgi:hypothetical protein
LSAAVAPIRSKYSLTSSSGCLTLSPMASVKARGGMKMTVGVGGWGA